MFPNATIGLIGLVFLSLAETDAQELKLDWRRIGNSALRHPTGEAASGPVDRVWFTIEGRLATQTKGGAVWEMRDGEHWTRSTAQPPDSLQRESGLRAYRVDGDAFRSDDGGRSWVNLTSYRGYSVLGGNLADVAVSPNNVDDIAVAGTDGVWRSLDGGETWSGVNGDLPNLSIARIVSTPAGTTGLRAVASNELIEWQPGQKLGWSRIGPADPELTTAVERRGEYVYRGTPDGLIVVTRSGVALPATGVGGSVKQFWVDSNDPAIALAVAGSKLMRTLSGGLVWDEITGGLPEGRLNGVTADRASGAIYVAGERGLFYGTTDFNVMGAAPSWQKLTSLPDASATDVKLDPAANQLYLAVEGYGIFATLAPHRRRAPALVSAADLAARAAAPGALMSLIGQGVTTVRSGDRVIPVLAATDSESQLQVPFEAEGNELALRLESGSSRWNMTLALDAASPAIFVDRDGSPMLLDGNSGILLDAMNPARSGARLQILATGLGRVNPAWPTGLEAPLDNPPAVTAAVKVFLDGQPLEVTRATLAPGYTGFYLVEAEMPTLVNAGSAELRLEVDGRASNRVRVYIEP